MNSRRKDKTKHETDIRGGLVWVSFMLGVVALTLGILSQAPHQQVFFGCALLGMLITVSTRFVPARVGLAAVTTWSGPFILFLLYLLLPLRIPVLDRTYKPIPLTPTGIWETDPQLGYSHIPNTQGPHLSHDFDVVYTIDEHGYRVTPTPKSSRGRVLMVGGSFAVGHGVEDDETFSSVLGERYWKDYKLANGAVSGWGTANCYLRTMAELQSDDPPVLVIYAMIWQHVERNYIRREWLEHLRFAHASRVDGKLAVGVDGIKTYHPHFELVDDQLQLQGIINREAGLDVTPALVRTELELTNAFIREMHETATSQGVEFAVVLLGHAEDPYDPAFLAFMDSLGIVYLDLSDTVPDGFYDDEHPNPADHRWIAKQIAQSPIANLLRD